MSDGISRESRGRGKGRYKPGNSSRKRTAEEDRRKGRKKRYENETTEFKNVMSEREARENRAKDIQRGKAKGK